MCTYIANGTKIKDPSACNTYITCVDDEPISGTCGNLFYDRNTGECVDPSTVKCYSSNPCAATPGVNEFVPDPYSCNGYYYCSNGKGTHGECSAGWNFNPDSKNCIRNFSCEITILPEDLCNIVPDGVFIKVPGTCTEYQTCWRNTLLNGTCPDTFYFNPFTGQCDYPSEVDCPDATTPQPEIPETVECTIADVFIADGRTCNGYYYCRGNSNGTIDLIHGNCPVDRFFNPANNGSCVIRTNITCPYNRCVTLGLDYIQLANINNDGCTGFSICQDGEEIAKSSCPTDQYFDEMSQRCTTDVITYPACALMAPTETTTELPDTTATEELPNSTATEELPDSTTTAELPDTTATAETEAAEKDKL